jgi:hypothetical protein
MQGGLHRRVTVIHACLPEGAVRWYQEIGRASRDGHQGLAACLFTNSWTERDDVGDAFGQATASWLTREIAESRWRALMERGVSSRWIGARRRLTLDLDATREGLPSQSSDYNRTWNMSLLNLMQRAGVLAVVAVASEFDEIGARWEVELIDHGLLERGAQAIWDRIFAIRNSEQAVAGEDLKAFVRLMTKPTEQCLTRAVFDLVEQDPASDAPPCGRCPGCRARGVPPPGHLSCQGLNRAWAIGLTTPSMLPQGPFLVVPEDEALEEGFASLLRRLAAVGMEQFLVPDAVAYQTAQILAASPVHLGLVLGHSEWVDPPAESLARLPTSLLLPLDETTAAALLQRSREFLAAAPRHAYGNRRPAGNANRSAPPRSNRFESRALCGGGARSSRRAAPGGCMSLLSSTQGTPERVWSLLVTLSACGGSLGREDAAGWMNPGFVRDGNRVQEKPDAVIQTLSAATSLGALEVAGAEVRVLADCPVTTFAAFCDWVHDRLVRLDSGAKDAVVLETYAWLAAESDKQRGVNWYYEGTRDSFADAADRALPDEADDDGTRRMNSTKLPAWRRWLSCLGLLVPMPLSLQPYPAAGARAARELHRAGLPVGQEIAAEDFLRAMAPRLPYLDGGRMFAEAARRIQHVISPRRLSPMMSGVLRDLHDERRIEIRIRGDSSKVFNLFPEPTHTIQEMVGVVMMSGSDS